MRLFVVFDPMFFIRRSNMDYSEYAFPRRKNVSKPYDNYVNVDENEKCYKLFACNVVTHKIHRAFRDFNA